MFSVKKNILQTVSLLKEYGIKHIVFSPGSRNAPIIQTFSQDNFFECQVIVDERNAAFYAIGIIQCTQQPVIICCTSGTALLNYAPAVAEAYYQQLPLIVISADRTPEWIGQMDGQTICQEGSLDKFVKKTVHLPQIKDESDEWFCNRLLNDALIQSLSDDCGPVHINIPIAEPLFDYSVMKLPKVRKINNAKTIKSVDVEYYVNQWSIARKRMIIIGQIPPSQSIESVLEKIITKSDCVVLAEHLSNSLSASFVSNFDVILSSVDEEKVKQLSPDLLITFGGHIVSKKIKQVIRKNKPLVHWHINESGNLVDLYQSLTDQITANPILFFNNLLANIEQDIDKNYNLAWNKLKNIVTEPFLNSKISDILATGLLMKSLKKGTYLHLANSSAVRYAQLFVPQGKINIYCNRGTNGIESSLASAVGFASVTEKPVFLLIGDLSFFYSLSALWNIEHIKNLRILLLNNQGGSIFHQLRGLENAESLESYVVVKHHQNAEKWAIAANFEYMNINHNIDIEMQFQKFVEGDFRQSVIFEVATDSATSISNIRSYYQQIKNLINKR